MRALWIGQHYGVGLRECMFVDDETKEQSTFFATDEQVREFATEMKATIHESGSYDAELNLTDPWEERWRWRGNEQVRMLLDGDGDTTQ